MGGRANQILSLDEKDGKIMERKKKNQDALHTESLSFSLLMHVHRYASMCTYSRLRELIIKPMRVNHYHIDYYFSNLLWHRTPLQISFLQTDCSARLAEKFMCLGKMIQLRKQIPRSMHKVIHSIQRDSVFVHLFYIISLSSSVSCLLHCLSLFRCNFVSGAVRPRRFTFTGSEHTDIPAI